MKVLKSKKKKLAFQFTLLNCLGQKIWQFMKTLQFLTAGKFDV